MGLLFEYGYTGVNGMRGKKSVLRQKINIEDAKAVVACLDYKTINKAAEALCITQPSLSIRLGNLEDRLEMKVLNRKRPRGKGAGYQFLVSPAPEGQGVVNYCYRLLEFVEDNELEAITKEDNKPRRYLSKFVVGAA